MTAIVFLATFGFPSILMYFGQSSIFIGTFLVFSFYFLYKKSRIVQVKFYISIMILLIASALVFIYSGDIKNIARLIATTSAIIVALFGASGFVYFFKSKSPRELKKNLKRTFFLFLLSGLFCVFFREGGSPFNRPMFPFIEPSHFFIYMAYIVTWMAFLSKKTFITMVVIMIMTAIFVDSLVGIVLSIYITIINILISARFRFIFPLLVVATVFILAYSVFLRYGNVSYYSERLVLSQNNQNLSVLIFLQGWESISDSIISRSVLGRGIGQTDISSQNLVSTHLIYKITGKHICNSDGGFIFSRLIFEFGFIAFMICVLFWKYYFKAFIFITRNSQKIDKVIASSLLIYPFELFIRSPGLISPSLIFIFGACVVVGRNSKKTRLI